MRYQWERSQSFVATPHVTWINTQWCLRFLRFLVSRVRVQGTALLIASELLSKAVNFELLQMLRSAQTNNPSIIKIVLIKPIHHNILTKGIQTFRLEKNYLKISPAISTPLFCTTDYNHITHINLNHRFHTVRVRLSSTAQHRVRLSPMT